MVFKHKICEVPVEYTKMAANSKSPSCWAIFEICIGLICGILIMFLALCLLYPTILNPVRTSVTSADTFTDDWDLIIFSQQWPQTSCIDHKDKKHGASCNLYKNVTSWTVHGMWPTKRHTKGPTSCNSSWVFNETQIQPLESKLLKYWTNIYAETPEDSLWQHEWSKHGTCAAELPALNSEFKYFHTGLQWAVFHDLKSALSFYDINPSDTQTYTSDQIFNAIIDLFKVDPIVNCIYHKEKKQQLLSQIKLCFNRDLQMMSCNDAMSASNKVHRGNCPPEGIVYPKDVKLYS